jgi:hypothetical protein
MIRQRFSTLLTALGLLVSLTAVSVAIPVSTLAATPNVTVGLGTEAIELPAGATSAQPTTVSPGAKAAFSIWARNDDPSTVSQFFLTETTGASIYSVSWSSSTGQRGSCLTNLPLNCSFGQLKPGQAIDAFIVVQTAGTSSPMPVDFVWNTVGVGHGYSFLDPDSVALSGDAVNFSGRFLIGSDLLPVGDVDVTSTNKQSTIVYSPTTGIGVTVQDGPGVSSACVPVSTCFGETSEIHVGNGSAQYGQFKVVLNLQSSEIPPGVTANNLKVYHDGVQITTICGTPATANCYSVAKFKWGLQVTIWLLQNGKLNIG